MREKNVVIDGIEVGFKTSAAVPVLFNREFTDKDFFVSMNKIQEAYNSGNEEEIYKAVMVVQEMAYIFAKHYNEFHQKPFDFSYLDWLAQFETFSVLNITEEILGLWAGETETKSTAKKKAKKPTEK